MDMLFKEYSPLGDLFAICAIIGGILFMIQLGLQLLGGIGNWHIPHATELTGTDAHISDSDVSFKWLSMQGLTAFFTMFGLVGLAMEQGEYGEALSLLAALTAGLITLMVIQKLFRVMGGLQSKGNINIQNAIGKEGMVYLTISPPERGKIEINIQNRLRVLEAVSLDETPFPTGERVRVAKILDSHILVVERVTGSVAVGKAS